MKTRIDTTCSQSEFERTYMYYSTSEPDAPRCALLQSRGDLDSMRPPGTPQPTVLRRLHSVVGPFLSRMAVALPQVDDSSRVSCIVSEVQAHPFAAIQQHNIVAFALPPLENPGSAAVISGLLLISTVVVMRAVARFDRYRDSIFDRAIRGEACLAVAMAILHRPLVYSVVHLVLILEADLAASLRVRSKAPLPLSVVTSVLVPTIHLATCVIFRAEVCPRVTRRRHFITATARLVVVRTEVVVELTLRPCFFLQEITRASTTVTDSMDGLKFLDAITTACPTMDTSGQVYKNFERYAPRRLVRIAWALGRTPVDVHQLVMKAVQLR